MSTELNWNDWITLAGAVGAFVVGSVNLWWALADRSDDIYVGFGLQPSLSEYSVVSITNRSKHQVRIADYGLILFSGKLRSMPWQVEIDGYEGLGGADVYLAKKTILDPRDAVEAGENVRGRVAGVWAQTTLQQRPRLRFYKEIPIWQRVAIRMKVFRAPEFE